MSIQQSLNQALYSIARTKIGGEVLKTATKLADFDVKKANERLENMRVQEAADRQEYENIESQTKGFGSREEQHEFEEIVNKTQPVYSEPSVFGGETLTQRYLELRGHRTGIEERKEILRKYASPYVIGTGEGR